jgi:hypothetical protein
VNPDSINQLLSDEHTTDILIDAYKSTNKHLRKGMFNCAFNFLAFYLLVMAIFPVILTTTEESNRRRIA